MEDEALYDVFAINIKTLEKRKLSDRLMTVGNAEAFINMAIARRGVDEEIYIKRPRMSTEPSTN